MSSKKKSKKPGGVREKKTLLPPASIEISDNMENEESSFIAESYNSNSTNTEETVVPENTDLATPEPDQSQQDTESHTKVSDGLEKEIKKLQTMNQKLRMENQSLRTQLDLASERTSRKSEKSEFETSRVADLENRIQVLEEKLSPKNLQKFIDLKPEKLSEALSAPAKNELFRKNGDSNRVKPMLSRKVSQKVIYEFSVQQSNQSLENGQALTAHQPFFVQSHLRLPRFQSSESFDTGLLNYGIHVIVKESNSNNTIEEKDFAENVVSGTTDYKNRLSLPGLDPGNYMMNFCAVVPFMRISEQKNISLIVK